MSHEEAWWCWLKCAIQGLGERLVLPSRPDANQLRLFEKDQLLSNNQYAPDGDFEAVPGSIPQPSISNFFQTAWERMNPRTCKYKTLHVLTVLLAPPAGFQGRFRQGDNSHSSRDDQAHSHSLILNISAAGL